MSLDSLSTADLRPSRGRSHGTSRSAPFDRWFRYPAGFASEYAALLLDETGIKAGTVVDCFAGSGVTGTAARSRGLNFQGIEAHPLVAELAALKLRSQADPEQLTRSARSVIRSASTVNGANSSETELVQRSFSPAMLNQLISLRNTVRELPDQDHAKPYLKWALLATLRDVAGVKVGWPYQQPSKTRVPRHGDAPKRFYERVEQMAQDVALFTADTTRHSLAVGDARDPRPWSKLGGLADACISSPPYLNNFDYADATRLELYFWGEVSNWREMCDHVRVDMLTATTQQSSIREKSESLSALGTDGRLQEIVELCGKVEAVRGSRPGRTKEYDQVVPAYFDGILNVLANLHAGLRPGAKALWLIGDSAPYGVYVDTPRLIGRCAEVKGFKVLDDVVLRSRGHKWTSNTDRHKVSLTERLLVLEA